jgi:hypothetical protein
MRPCRPQSLLFLLGCLLFEPTGQCLAQPPVAYPVAAHDSGPRRSPSRYAGHEGHSYESRTVTLKTGDVAYGLHYRACVDKAHGDRVGVVEGYLGMPAPSRENWYGGGFLRFHINDDDVGTYRLAGMRVTEQGRRGALELVWELPLTTVRLRFLLESGANHVKMECLWVPRPEIKSVKLQLLCFPSFFTSWHNRKGDRHILTPQQDVPEGRRLTVTPGEDPYLFYCDTVFDVARGEGTGPCAVLLTDKAVTGGRADIGGYGTTTVVNLAPETGRFRAAFWEFPGQTNAEALIHLKGNWATTRKELEDLDFRPTALASDGIAALVAEGKRLLDELGPDPQAPRQLISDLSGKLEQLAGMEMGSNWRVEHEVLDTLPRLNNTLWELRTLALLKRGDEMAND